MAEIFNFYVNDNRSITFKLSEPIMLEDNGVSDWRFHIPNIVNGLDATGWAWWLVYVNAKNEKYTIPLTLEYDYDRPDAYSIATYTVDYGMSCKVGNIKFSLESIDADTGGTILHEWHTKTYSTNVVDTLQGNQVEYAETESDIISALLIEVRNKVNQLVGGATPEPKNLIADMIDPDKVYLYIGNEPDESTGYWYYHNGTRFIPGGVYGAGVIDQVPTQGSTNAVSSGGVYTALHNTDTTLTQSGQAADAKVVGDEVGDLRRDLSEVGNCFVENQGESEQVTLTNEANISEWASGASLREGLALPTISDGVASLVNNGTSTLSPYAGSNVLISGTIIVGFKFRFVKLDPTLSDPEDFKIIIGQSNSREYSPNFGEWIDYSDVFTIGESELKRIRLSARNFPSSLTSGQFKLEIKDMYVYDASGVSAEMRTFIQNQQSINYQDGTVTYGEASSTTFSPDNTLSLSGKAADSKAVGDAISNISGDLSTVSNAVDTFESDIAPMQDAVGLFTDELSATLTDLNAQANIFADSSSTWEFSSLSDGVFTFVPKTGADVNVYGSNPCALGTGKWLVSFKYKLTKLDEQLSNPTDVKVILGSSGESYTYEDYQFDTWTEFTKITEVNLTRVYLSVRGFATVPTPTQVKLEIKEFYIYNLANIDGGLYSTIIAKQNEDYKSGTVTYTKLSLSEDITGSFSQINVKNYGVKGDGVTDDTNAINTLFASRTGNFYFPSGTYKISGTITLPSKSTMYGDGDATVIDMHSCDNLTQCVFRGGTSIYPYLLVSGNHTKLHDFKLIGNNVTQEKRHAGILVMDAENCFISNLTVYNINYYPSQTDPNVNAYGICILRSYRAYIDHCYVEQCGYECIGIADMSHHCVVKNCIAKNGWRTCIQVHRGAYDVDIVGNQMIQNAQAWDACFTLHGLSGDNLVRNLRIINNTFEATVSPRERLEEYAAVVQLMSYCDGLWFVNNRIVSGDRNLCAEQSVTHLYLLGNLFQCSDPSDYRLKILTDSPIIVGNVLENTSGTTQTIPASAVMSGNLGIS